MPRLVIHYPFQRFILANSTPPTQSVSEGALPTCLFNWEGNDTDGKRNYILYGCALWSFLLEAWGNAHLWSSVMTLTRAWFSECATLVFHPKQVAHLWSLVKTGCVTFAVFLWQWLHWWKAHIQPTIRSNGWQPWWTSRPHQQTHRQSNSMYGMQVSTDGNKIMSNSTDNISAVQVPGINPVQRWHLLSRSPCQECLSSGSKRPN